MTEIQPPTEEHTYNQTYQGVFGEFGASARAQIIYLQTAIRPTQLDQLTLISDIPGSETWSIRDLFQREVNTKRVTKSILPYLQNDEKVKFFNPLTLTLLPLDPDTFKVQEDPPDLIESEFQRDGRGWRALEANGLFRFRHIDGAKEYGALDWNDERVRIVAIDGQHRLSALKRYKADANANDEFSQWHIPVVTFAVKPLEPSRRRDTILEVIRNIFVYINKEAKQPTRARQILLSDESVNSICTQEVLDYAHGNDSKTVEKRDPDVLPLLLFDWRGPGEGGSREAPAALVTVEEVHDWLENYILGEDFSTSQKKNLNVQPIENELHEVFRGEGMSVSKNHLVREKFNEEIREGVVYVLENFGPFQEYTEGLRELEHDYSGRSDIARHAFHKLRFGSHRAGQDEVGDVEEVFSEICEEVEGLKRLNIPELLRRDVGMRGVMCSLGILRDFYIDSAYEEGYEGEAVSYKGYCKWFTHAVNMAYSDGWFDLGKEETSDVLHHIVVDSNDNIINYRLTDAESAYGALLACVVASYGRSSAGLPSAEEFGELQERYLDELENTLQKGYKRDIRPRLKEEYPTKTDTYREELSARSEARTKEHMELIDRIIGDIIAS